ncbi:MAG: hypothetical protein ACYDGN_15830 [Acidimicrobiales bacterium]
MILQQHLDSEQRHTLEHLSSHPLPTNIKWPQVLSLLRAIGEVTVESKNRYSVTVEGRTEVFRPPDHHGDMSPDIVMKLRHFLASSPATETPESGSHLVAVVDQASDLPG